MLDLLPTALVVLSAVIAGASVALKVIAPLTKTTKDDSLLRLLEKALQVLSLHVPAK